MKGLVIAFVAFVACAAAQKSLHYDLYRNTLQANERIIGGVEAERRQFPYIVSVQWCFLGSCAHICGGSLVAPKYVLTAAHCRAYSIGSYQVVAGQRDQAEEHEDIQQSSVDKFTIHPEYDGGVAPNDVAVIKLKNDLTITDSVQLVELPAEGQCRAPGNSILSGWGLTSNIPIPPARLRYALLPLLTLEGCRDALIELLGEAGPLDATMICTGAQEGTKQSACSGDSGGPLVEVAGQNRTQCGVVSWGITPCGTKGAPSVYTDVLSHLDFIRFIIGGS